MQSSPINIHWIPCQSSIHHPQTWRKYKIHNNNTSATHKNSCTKIFLPDAPQKPLSINHTKITQKPFHFSNLTQLPIIIHIHRIHMNNHQKNQKTYGKNTVRFKTKQWKTMAKNDPKTTRDPGKNFALSTYNHYSYYACPPIFSRPRG